MKADILVCSAWRDAHDRPVYTFAETCPECGASAENSAPAPFNPADPHGSYRRALKRRRRE
jgi:H/ACA ribonucleoprotein complex subunit 3